MTDFHQNRIGAKNDSQEFDEKRQTVCEKSTEEEEANTLRGQSADVCDSFERRRVPGLPEFMNVVLAAGESNTLFRSGWKIAFLLSLLWPYDDQCWGGILVSPRKLN